MFSKGISIPSPFKNACIAVADSAGLAVNTKIFSLPNLSIAFLSLGANGPGSPLTTLLKSLKSNLAPAFAKLSPCFAN